MDSFEPKNNLTEINPNGLNKKSEDEKKFKISKSKGKSKEEEYEFELNVDIRKLREEAIIEECGQLIYEAEWIDQQKNLPVVLREIFGVKTKKAPSYYVKLSSHPHLVQIYGFVNNQSNSIILVEERSNYGHLYQLFIEKKFQPNERILLKLFEQICDAMIYLISKNILHGDLSSRNVCLFQLDTNNSKEYLIKLNNFGLTKDSKIYSIDPNSHLPSKVRRYLPPELTEHSKKENHSEKSDVYSMGILMLEACSYGNIPFSHTDDQTNLQPLKLENETLLKPSICSEHFWTIIKKCCEQKPKNRPNFKSLKKSLIDLQRKFDSQSKSNLIPEIHLNGSNLRSEQNIIDKPRYGTSKNDREEYDKRKLISEDDNELDDTNSIEEIDIDNGSSSCPFCKEYFPSIDSAREHLLECGTKTDQCPNCRKYIQRANFAYHYENNCANLNDIQISDQINRTNLPRSLTENFKEINPSTISNNNDLSDLIICEYCRKDYTQSNYQFHKDYCLDNPANQNNNRQVTSDENPVIPCEYCQELYSGAKLHLHETSCSKNPNRRVSSVRLNQPSNIDYNGVPLLTNPGEGISNQLPRLTSTNNEHDEKLDGHGCCILM